MTGIFAVLDDIAMLMDDTAVMTKIAAKKTTAILGDDLAVGAEQASGFKASRELPVIFAIAKGAFLNKLIILPFAFILSYFAPYTIVPILLFGGIYLSYEGTEKIIETFFYKHNKKEDKEEIEEDLLLNKSELLEKEKDKIKAAIKTDFILSIEIIIVALGVVVNHSLITQIMVVTFVAIAATIGVYGIVALLVRTDDVGYKLIELSKGKKNILYKTGMIMVMLLPKMIKALAIIGTIAMLLVGGGMFFHNIDFLHHNLTFAPSFVIEFFIGLIIGTIVFLIQKVLKRYVNNNFIINKIKGKI